MDSLPGLITNKIDWQIELKGHSVMTFALIRHINKRALGNIHKTGRLLSLLSS